MVSALYRDNAKMINKNTVKQVSDRAVDDVDQIFVVTKSFPSGLREFVNSNSDLPTIEELAQRSQTLAHAMGMAS